MSIAIHVETLLTLSQAARSLPSRPHWSTLQRWRVAGIRGVKLETCLIGGRRFTSAEALERFCNSTTAAANGEPQPVRTPRQRERDMARAEQELGGKTTHRSSPKRQGGGA